MVQTKVSLLNWFLHRKASHWHKFTELKFSYRKCKHGRPYWIWIGCFKMYSFRRLSQQHRVTSCDVWRHPEEFGINKQLFVSIYLEFCLIFNTLRKAANTKDPKYELYSSGIPSPEALKDYTTNRTLHLPTIHCLLRGKWVRQLKRFIILSILRIYSSITKEIIKMLRNFTTELLLTFGPVLWEETLPLIHT